MIQNTTIIGVSASSLNKLINDSTNVNPLNSDAFPIHKNSIDSLAKVNFSDLSSGFVTISNGLWKTLTSFNPVPVNQFEISLSEDFTSVIQPGMSLKYEVDGVYYYAIIDYIDNVSLTISGAPFPARLLLKEKIYGDGDPNTITNIYYDGGEVTQLQTIIPSAYETTDSTALIFANLKSSLTWDKKTSYIVKYKFYSNLIDSGSNGQASVRINNIELNRVAGGLTINQQKEWISTLVDIDPLVYKINYGDLIELTCIKGSSGTASDLTSKIIFITP